MAEQAQSSSIEGLPRRRRLAGTDEAHLPSVGTRGDRPPGDDAGNPLAGQVQLLTRPGGEVEISDDVRSHIAVFADGRILVSAPHYELPAVQTVLQKVRTRYPGMRVVIDFVDIDELATVYRAVSDAGAFAAQVPMQRRITDMLREAADCGASDIWLRPAGSVVEELWRINGSYTPVMHRHIPAMIQQLNRALHAACDGKSSPEYDTRRPMNGRLSAKQQAIGLPKGLSSLRVTWGTVEEGHDTAIRLLYAEPATVARRKADTDPVHQSGLKHLDYLPGQIELMRLMCEETEGGVFIGGPTGSGKTTLMKEFVDHYLEERRYTVKAVSIENPPEFTLTGVTQLTSSSSFDGTREDDYNELHAQFVRLDPDVGIIGEIHDEVTCESSMKVVESGHWTIGTTHAFSPEMVVGRLRDFEAPPWLLSDPDCIRGLIFQRLVPALCQHCCLPMSQLLMDRDVPQVLRDAYATVGQRFTTMATQHGFKSDAIDFEAIRVRSLEGCTHCELPAPVRKRLEAMSLRTNTRISFEAVKGVRGRVPVAEIVRPDRRYLELALTDQYGASTPREHWIRNLGGIPIQKHVILRIIQGQIDPLDAHRVKSMATDQSRAVDTLAAVSTSGKRVRSGNPSRATGVVGAGRHITGGRLGGM